MEIVRLFGVIAGLCFLSALTWIPALALTLRKPAQKDPARRPARKDLYLKTILWQLKIAALALVISVALKISIFGVLRPDFRTAILALAFLALNFLCIEPLEWKFASAESKEKVRQYSPHTGRERLLFIPTSLLVALSEEIIFRAVFFGLLYRLTENYWIAGVVSAIFFSLIHLTWNLAAAGSTFLVGLGLQYLVFVSGGLYIAIAVHFIHNIVNGVIYGRLGKKGSAPDSARESLHSAAEGDLK